MNLDTSLAKTNIEKFDAIIVGAGQAGPPLAQRFSKAGKTVALIERKLLGGTCVNVGCTLTKAMIASAEAAERARSGADFGFDCSNVAVDLMKVKARKDRIIEASRSGLEKMITELKGCTLFRGMASFESATTMRVNNQIISAPAIFLNVGARPATPKLEGLESVPYLTSSTILDLSETPKHLIIIGGSYIGVEFAQIFRRFGANVTVIEQSERLLMREDEDASKTVREILEAEGVHFYFTAEKIRLIKNDNGISVSFATQKQNAQTVSGSHLLLAIGRTPNTDDLSIEKAGLKIDKKGYVEVDDELKTNVPGIWALGDCNGKGAFTHTAYNDYEIVAANFFDQGSRKISDRIPAHALYTDPALAQIGMTESEVRATGQPALIGITPMTSVQRAVDKGETLGAIKILVDAASDQILGATLIGPSADEAIHSILTAMYSKVTATSFGRQMNIHPTVSELIPTTLQSLKPLA